MTREQKLLGIKNYMQDIVLHYRYQLLIYTPPSHYEGLCCIEIKEVVQ